MALPGITLVEGNSGGSPDSGIEYKAALVTAHPTLVGAHAITAETDVVTLVGAGDLADILAGIQANGGQNLFFKLYCAAVVDEANIQTLIDDLTSAHTVSMIGINAPLTAAWVTAINGVKTTLLNRQEFHEFMMPWELQTHVNLEAVTIAVAAGDATIPWTANGLSVSDEIQVRGSDLFDGRHTLTAVTTDTVTFASGAAVADYLQTAGIAKELSEDYTIDVDTTLTTSSCDHLMPILPFTEMSHFGAALGRVASTPPQRPIYAHMIGGVNGVLYDNDITTAVHISMNDARVNNIKRSKNDRTKLYFTDEKLLSGTTDDIKRLSERRVMNKVKRLTLFAADALVGSDIYDPNDSGAGIASAEISKFVKDEMLNPEQDKREILEYNCTITWITNGMNVSLDYVDVHKTHFINITVTATKAV